MAKKQKIQLFEEKKVRTVWDDDKEKWFFCVVDVVEALTESKDPKDYIKKMKKRDPELSKGWGQIVTPLTIHTPGGPQKVNCAPREGVSILPFANYIILYSEKCDVNRRFVSDIFGRVSISL